MTKAKVEASSPVHALLSGAVKAEAHKMNQIKGKDAHSKPKRDPSSSRKEVKRHEKARRSTPGSIKSRNKPSVRRTVPDSFSAGDGLSKDSGGKTDSSSETSESTSEENRATNNDVLSSNFETDNRGADTERTEDLGGEEAEMIACDFPNSTLMPALERAERSLSPFTSMDGRWKFSAFGALEISGDGAHDDLLREIDDLRSENEYLKDEMVELRSEMLEMRDLYMEEDVYQLQELKQQLEQANKTCRILQYRLRKAERRSLRVAQTGQVDGELIRTLEHDVRVAKSVSLRLHTELEAVQKKSLRLEWENEELRERLQNLEVAKQVLQAEMNKSRENSLKRRSLRSAGSKSEKKICPQDDSADLKCQLHFAKEESALMCKKLTKMAEECETMREDLSKYRLLYGDVDASQATAGTVNSVHTRESEVKVHLRLVEEEATLLSRRIVELEVENRGLRAEMNEMQERAGWGQEEEDEVIEGREKCLAMSLSVGKEKEANGVTHNGNPECEERTEGVAGVENCPLSHILREESMDVVMNHPQDQNIYNEDTEKDQGCTASLKNLEPLLAIRDQAMLVRSIIQFLIPPAKNGFSPMSNHNLISSHPFLSKIEVDSHCLKNPLVFDPMMSPLTSGLEVLQAQLHTLVVKLDVLVSSVPTETGQDTNAEEVLETVEQVARQCPAEKKTCHPISNKEQNCSQDSLELLTVQLRWFLKQWCQGKRPSGEDKNLFEMDFQNDLYPQIKTDLLGSKKTCNSTTDAKPHEKCHKQVSTSLLSDLEVALQDLCCKLQEEYRAGQHIAQQFAEAKAAWTVERTELRSLISSLEDTSEAKNSLDPKMALQKDYFEELQNLLDESHAAVIDVTRQLKLCEHNWNCEPQELLTYLSEVHLDWGKQNKDSESQASKSPQKRGETKRLTRQAPSTQRSNKNWIYLSQEAALVDREDPWKTWDCPMMPPSFSGLNLKQTTAKKSHTAPEKTTLRIYYSPPSARRIILNAVPFEDEDKYEKKQEKEEPNCHHSNHINETNICDTWQGTLPIQCRSMIEQSPFAVIRSNSSSGFQSPGVSSSSCLPFSGWEVSENLSDDMKEMTASVLERRRRSISSSRSVGVISIGTQTHTQPQVNSVGLQTDIYQSVYASKHRSPRVPSFVSARSQNISSSLDRMPGPLEKPPACSTSPKLQRRHSTSSPFSSSSSSSNTTNSSYSFSSASLSSSSLSSSSRLEPPKDRSLWGPPQCSSGNTKSSSAFGGSSEKSVGRRTAGIHKYGLVQEFFRNVCGRGEKPNPPNSGGEKIQDIRRDHVSPARVKKTEGPPSRIPTGPLGRSDNVTRIVNHRFMKQGRKDEPRLTQTQTQGQCQNQTKTPMGKDKGFGPATLEDGSCRCSSRTLASCFARVSRTNLRHSHSHCKLRPTAAGGKGNMLSQ